MDIPSRRTRKQTGSRRTLRGLLLALILLLGLGFIVYVAINTGNYMGLAASFVLVFFFVLGLNLGNIRRFIPGLTSEQKEVKYPAIFLYTCLGFAALTMAGHLPNTKFLPLESGETSLPQPKPGSGQDDKISAVIMPENQPAQKSPPTDSDASNILASAPQEPQREQTAAVVKMDGAMNSMVATQIIDAQLIEINNQDIVRLLGVQVPDYMQNEAAALVKELLYKQQVSLTICEERPKDEHDRIRAVVKVNGTNVNQKLIESGYSPLIVTKPCSIDLASWQSIENLAKQQKRGIWAKHPQ